MSDNNTNTKTFNKKFGEVQWTEVPSGNDSKGGRDTFLRLSPGSNIVRICTLPYQFYLHRYVVENGPKWGARILCSAPNGACAICESGGDNSKAKRRWLLGVIDKTGAYKILDIGYPVFKDIQTLSRSDWGDPSKYDVDIVVDQNGGPTGYYSVVPMPPKPMTAVQLKAKEEGFSAEQLEQLTTPPSPQEVREKMEKVLADARSSSDFPTETNGTVEEEKSEDDFFKNYDKATGRKVMHS